jgi:hypothetical protein
VYRYGGHIFCGDFDNPAMQNPRTKNPASDKLWAFDVLSRVWRAVDVDPAGGPGPRTFHVFVAFKESLYLLGGLANPNYLDGPRSRATIDLFKLSLPNDKESRARWSKVAVKGGKAKQPCARQGAAATVYRGALLLCGGETNGGDLINDLWRYLRKHNSIFGHSARKRSHC